MTAPTIRRTNVLAAYRTQDGSKVWDIPICIYDNRVYLLFPSGDLWPVTEWYKFTDEPEDVKFVCYSPVSTMRPCDIFPVLEFIKTLPAPVANTPQKLRPAPEPPKQSEPPKPKTLEELIQRNELAELAARASYAK
jgi:hypothetical protein